MIGNCTLELLIRAKDYIVTNRPDWRSRNTKEEKQFDRLVADLDKAIAAGENDTGD